MKKVYASLDFLMAGHVKNLLLNEGIFSFTKNDHLASAAGEVPPNECWFEVWIANDQEYDEAERIVQIVLSDAYPSGPEWGCSACGQENEHQFSACWKCGTEQYVGIAE